MYFVCVITLSIAAGPIAAHPQVPGFDSQNEFPGENFVGDGRGKRVSRVVSREKPGHEDRERNNLQPASATSKSTFRSADTHAHECLHSAPSNERLDSLCLLFSLLTTPSRPKLVQDQLPHLIGTRGFASRERPSDDIDVDGWRARAANFAAGRAYQYQRNVEQFEGVIGRRRGLQLLERLLCVSNVTERTFHVRDVVILL